jgi:hypothetical protein
MLLPLTLILVAFPTVSTSALPGGAVYFSGEKGFDIACAPDQGTMNAWWEYSPYWDIGVYLGGRNVTCKNNTWLTANWVSSNVGPWEIIPTWVDYQAPYGCFNGGGSGGFYNMSSDTNTARAQGVQAGRDAMARAEPLGFARATVIYLDIEQYTDSNPVCHNAVKWFVDGWVGVLHAEFAGTNGGVYYSDGVGNSGINDWATVPNPPDVIWGSNWNNNTHTSYPGLSGVNSGLWTNATRIHQYTGQQAEVWGGAGMAIDRDCSWGRLAGYGHGTNQDPSCN